VINAHVIAVSLVDRLGLFFRHRVHDETISAGIHLGTFGRMKVYAIVTGQAKSAIIFRALAKALVRTPP